MSNSQGPNDHLDVLPTPSATSHGPDAQDTHGAFSTDAHAGHEREHGAQEHDHEGHDHDGHDHGTARGGHGHGHGHGGHGHGGHGHGGHGHGVPVGNAPFGLAVGINAAFVLIEAGAGLAVGSTALVADAAHNLGDVLGLVLAWGAAVLAKRRPSATRSYGLRKSTVLASLSNAVVLLLFLGGVVWEALHRLTEPHLIEGWVVSLVAGIGVLINLGSALLFVRQARTDLNAKGAYLHLLADGMVSVAVLVAGGILAFKPTWYWIDPVVSIAVSLLVVRGAWQLLREALHLTLDGVPEHLDLEVVRTALLELPGVSAVGDLHVWAMSTSESALTAHLVVDEKATSELARAAGNLVKERFGIAHSTIQLDDSAAACVHC